MRRLAIPFIAAAVVAFAAPAGASAALSVGTSGNEVRITGDAADDRVSATANGTQVAIDFGVDGSIDAQFPMAGTSGVTANLSGGSDRFSATGNLAVVPFSVNGGAGNDEIFGTNGVDNLVGGSGADAIDGQQANDMVTGGTGGDTITWDPGDGSDVVDGGGDADVDTLDFNGSNIEETFTVNADGTGVRFTRNIGNIVMSLDRVDVLDLESFGGADNLTAAGVGNLIQVRADTGAGPDVVTTGNGADRIVGGTENDTIDTGAAGDRVFGGPGVDTLSGREGDDGIDGGDDADTINGGANTDGCDGGPGVNGISECESANVPEDLVPQAFPHPLEPEETPAGPDPVDPGPVDPGPVDPDPVETASPGFAIDRLSADRRGLRVAVSGTAAQAVEVEVEASETVKRAGRAGKRTVRYAGVTRAVPAGETVTVRLKAPRRHRATLASAKMRRATTTVTNVTNGLSETEEIRRGQ